MISTIHFYFFLFKRPHENLFVATVITLGIVSADVYAHGENPASKKPDAVQLDEEMTDDEIRKVDIDTKKITIGHGPIQNLDMPAMAMVFRSRPRRCSTRSRPATRSDSARRKPVARSQSRASSQASRSCLRPQSLLTLRTMCASAQTEYRSQFSVSKQADGSWPEFQIMLGTRTDDLLMCIINSLPDLH